MSEPTNLRVLTAEPRNESLIETLELAMEMARAGELSSISVAGILTHGGPYWNWSFVPNTSALIGAVERMKADIIRVTDE